jgi:transcriptional regulator with XRE-family HTH domain
VVAPLIGERIRRRRQQLGLSQAEVGYPYYSKSFISQVENGKLMPSLRALARIAERLQLPVSALVDESTHVEAHVARWLELAERCLMAERWDEWDQAVGQAIELCGQAGLDVLAGRTYEAYGDGWAQQCQYRRALDAYYLALIHYGPDSSPSTTIVHNKVGVVLGCLGNVKQAQYEFRQGLRLCAQHSDLHLKLIINLARTAAQLGDFAEARALYDEVMRKADAWGYARFVALAHVGLGSALSAEGCLAASDDHFSKAARVAAHLGTKDLCLLARHGLARNRLDNRKERKKKNKRKKK